eukprot:Blabericola_migrator_1__8687@NODE_4570_length_1080_cov_459_201382_g2839_i0_p1_GENE_NODE_4570_length_1080_cov_459_201382_g2839_i0NODE_4570_length_1080_cov_459_201382_g2839_i0_p1_ORF_typecomplete_len126_score16_88Cullin_Nedd8/PF10557_9/0_15_NODE_4570_length_1080_cov_459_201382_g2839_i0114491
MGGFVSSVLHTCISIAKARLIEYAFGFIVDLGKSIVRQLTGGVEKAYESSKGMPRIINCCWRELKKYGSRVIHSLSDLKECLVSPLVESFKKRIEELIDNEWYRLQGKSLEDIIDELSPQVARLE